MLVRCTYGCMHVQYKTTVLELINSSSFNQLLITTHLQNHQIVDKKVVLVVFCKRLVVFQKNLVFFAKPGVMLSFDANVSRTYEMKKRAKG